VVLPPSGQGTLVVLGHPRFEEEQIIIGDEGINGGEDGTAEAYW